MADAKQDPKPEPEPSVEDQLIAARQQVQILMRKVTAAQSVANETTAENTNLKFKLRDTELERDELRALYEPMREALTEAQKPAAARKVIADSRRARGAGTKKKGAQKPDKAE